MHFFFKGYEPGLLAFKRSRFPVAPRGGPSAYTASMRRRVWNIFCAVSLGLSVGLAWLWIRGARVSDLVERHWLVEGGRAVRFADIRSERGTLTVSFGRSQILTPTPPAEPDGVRVRTVPTGVVDGG